MIIDTAREGDLVCLPTSHRLDMIHIQALEDWID